MLKDFINWIQYKILIHGSTKNIVFKEKQVWWCSLGVNVGVEIDGKNTKFNMPVLIFKKFNHHQFWGIPLTSQIKQENDLYFKIQVKGKTSYVCLSQMRIFDSKRLNNLIFQMDKNIFDKIKDKIVQIIQKK
ncbi:MAG: type II toxin-antitoxin system PemK/MazF family toxin [bacterium]